MSLAESLAGMLPGRADSTPIPTAVPVDVKARMDRGRKAMLKDAAKRRLCMRFERGDTYWYVDNEGVLQFQSTVTNANGTGKPRHRIRNHYNFIRPIVEDKVSSATQRVPGYEIVPSSKDPEDLSAANVAQQVATFGYDKWRLRDVTVDTCTYAIGHGGDGFAFPYFDPDVGPYVPVRDPETGEVSYQGQGEVKILVLSGNEVYWESGVSFNESKWHAFERAEPLDLIKGYPGYIPGELQADASTSDIPTDKDGRDHMVMVTNYFERPCQKNPKGRWLRIANGRQICPEEGHPVLDTDGSVLDEPALHRLRYKHDPESDRDLGLTWQLIDAQRTVQDCANKLLEWKNRCLNPQMSALAGSLTTPRTDEPGATVYYKPGPNGEKPEWENPPAVPEALFRMFEMFKQTMRELSAYEDVHADPNVAAKTIQQVIEQSDARWQSFLGDLAEWHSRLMRHCLLLVARYYTEPRLIDVDGRFGTDLIKDFRGARLMGQVNVTVNPGSLKYRSRQEIQNKVSWIASTFPGYLSPEKAIAALDDGSAERLIESYELDVGKINRIIQGIRDGSVLEMPAHDHIDENGQPVIDPATGLPEQVPVWMPDVQDNEQVWKQALSDFMKTQEYERIGREMQAIARQAYTGIVRQEVQKQQAAAMAQNAMAQSLGAANAAKPATPASLPSLPALNG